MIPALPENDNQGGPPAHPREPATEQRFSDGYERDVLDFVNKQLDAGASEEGIVASLLAHDFGRYEARRLIRELARERDRARPILHRAAQVVSRTRSRRPHRPPSPPASR